MKIGDRVTADIYYKAPGTIIGFVERPGVTGACWELVVVEFDQPQGSLKTQKGEYHPQAVWPIK